MTEQFKKFQELFTSTYYDGNESDGGVYNFMEREIYKYRSTPEIVCPFQYEVKLNQTESTYDSYGSEDSKLKIVIYLPEYDIYVMFTGTRASYEGEYWDEYKQVISQQKIIYTYE